MTPTLNPNPLFSPKVGLCICVSAYIYADTYMCIYISVYLCICVASATSGSLDAASASIPSQSGSLAPSNYQPMIITVWSRSSWLTSPSSIIITVLQCRLFDKRNFWLRRKCQIFLQFTPIYQFILVLWCPIFGHPEMGSSLDQWYRIVQYFRIVASMMHFPDFQKNISSYNRPDICPPLENGSVALLLIKIDRRFRIVHHPTIDIRSSVRSPCLRWI